MKVLGMLGYVADAGKLAFTLLWGIYVILSDEICAIREGIDELIHQK